MLESRQGLGFFDKPVETPLISIGVLTPRNRLDLVVFRTRRNINRQVLFYGNRLIEVDVVGKVSDPETALAENTVNLVPVQAITVW